MFRFFSFLFLISPLLGSLLYYLFYYLFYYNQRSRRSRVPLSFSRFFFLLLFNSKCYVVFITQAYAQKSTRGTLGLLVPFEVGVRGGGYRTPRPPLRGTAGERRAHVRVSSSREREKPLVISRDY